MENLEPHKREEFWYNINVLRERDDLIFDIGLLAGRSRRKLIHSVCEASGLVRSRIGQNPSSAVLIKPPPTEGCDEHIAPPMVGSRVPRDRRPGELRKRIRRPQQVRNSVLGFVAKPLTLHNEKPNTMVRRVAITRRTLFSCFSLRFLAAPATRRDFEGAPHFFSAPKRRCPVG